MEIKLPPGLDWNIQRIASDTRYSSGLIEIQSLWSLGDIYRAHQTLDSLDEAQAVYLEQNKPKGVK